MGLLAFFCISILNGQALLAHLICAVCLFPDSLMTGNWISKPL